jgi:hypothetical protein
VTYDNYPTPIERLVRQAEHLKLLSEHVRELGDVRQVRITEHGAEDLPSLGGELWIIYYNLFAIAADLSGSE